MKKILLTLTLFICSTEAMAEWTMIGESDSKKGGYTVYADLGSILKAKGEAKMWTLVDHKIEQELTGTLYLSKKIRRKYDCDAMHTRILAYKLFSWEMGRGELVRTYSQPQEWKKVQRGSMNETEWKVACDK